MQLLLKRLAIAAFVIAILGLAYAFRNQTGGGHSLKKDTEAASHETSGSDQSTTDTLQLSRDIWDSAGLQIAIAETSPINECIELTGKIALNEDKLAHIFPLVEGRVHRVNVRFGQHVNKGDLLVVVESKEVGQAMLQLFQDRLKLKFAETRNEWTQEVMNNTLSLIKMMRHENPIDSIEQSLRERTMGDFREKLMTAYVANLKAKSNVQRLSPLSQSGAVPARQTMEAEAELSATRATLQSLLEQVSQDVVQASRSMSQTVKELQTTIAVAETNLKILGFQDQDLKDIDPAEHGEHLSHYPVIAPFDGTVISKDVVLLERVSPERQILAIADLSTVWVTVDIFEVHLPLLANLNAQKLRLRCEAWPDKIFEASIFYSGDVVQESTRTIALRAEAPNLDGLLKPGMFVKVELPNLQTGDRLQVPRSAILDHQGQSFVFVQLKDDQFARRNVTLGRQTSEKVEIRDGISAGDRVVIGGGFALKSKMLANLLAE